MSVRIALLSSHVAAVEIADQTLKDFLARRQR